jgi:RNA polymerase primary sigma factor
METEEEKTFYHMYVNELESITAGKENKKELLAGHLKGDAKCTKALTESYLPEVIKLSGEYSKSPLGRGDIVAEGNLALYEAVVEYKGSGDIDEFEKSIYEAVRKSIEKAVFAEIGSGRISDHLVERINALNDASTEMAKELGREASLEELSERLALSQDEIKELMKISIDALTVTETTE